MDDSFGKPGSDILNSQLKWLGSYDECLQTTGSYTPRNATFESRSEILGKYCKVSFAFDKANAEVTVIHSDISTIFGVSDQDRNKLDCTDTKVTRGLRFRLNK